MQEKKFTDISTAATPHRPKFSPEELAAGIPLVLAERIVLLLQRQIVIGSRGLPGLQAHPRIEQELDASASPMPGSESWAWSMPERRQGSAEHRDALAALGDQLAFLGPQLLEILREALAGPA